jgi:hypothetical protein
VHDASSDPVLAPLRGLLTGMSPERLETLYTSLPDGEQAALDVAVARVLNSRVDVARRRPMPMRIKALRAWFQRSRDDDLALDVLRGYLLGPRQQLVTDFLDATGVAHEEGQVEDDDASPDGAKVPEAVQALAAKHDPVDVRLYLEVARRQWPQVPELTAALESLPD